MRIDSCLRRRGELCFPILPACCRARRFRAGECIMSFRVNGELAPTGGGDTIPLIREVLTLGRRETCDIPLRFPNISGLHAELNFRNGYWYIRDRGSTNGLKVNGVR